LDQALQALPYPERKRLTDQVRYGFFKRGPVFTVRVHLFRGGGTAIGLTYSHAIGDLQTFISFMKTGSNLAARRTSEPPLLVLDRQRYLKEHSDGERGAPGLRRVG